METSTVKTAQIIKRMVTSRELLEHVGVHVGHGGFACCPLHREKTASLKVYGDPKRGWHCFGCGLGGSVIDLAMALWETDFRGACERLNDEFHLGLDLHRQLTAEEKRAFREKIAREQEERERRRRRVQEAETAYWAAFDAWMENDRVLTDQAPRSPEEPFTEAFVQAAVHRAEIQENLALAEEELEAARAGQWA